MLQTIDFCSKHYAGQNKHIHGCHLRHRIQQLVVAVLSGTLQRGSLMAWVSARWLVASHEARWWISVEREKNHAKRREDWTSGCQGQSSPSPLGCRPFTSQLIKESFKCHKMIHSHFSSLGYNTHNNQAKWKTSVLAIYVYNSLDDAWERLRDSQMHQQQHKQTWSWPWVREKDRRCSQAHPPPGTTPNTDLLSCCMFAGFCSSEQSTGGELSVWCD